jgi:hypothetical protein
MTIRPGDIVRLAGDTPLTAIVAATSREAGPWRYGEHLPKRGHLSVMPINSGLAQRDVRTRDVATHWKRVGR